MKKTMLLAATLLLSACAGTTTRDGLVYRDGSWYSPATEGRGDYYTGTRHRHYDAWDWPWAWSVGFVPYGGYCPAMYRYCTSFWADPWYGYYSGYYAYQPRPVPRRPPPFGQGPVAGGPDEGGTPSPGTRPDRPRPGREGRGEGRRGEGEGRVRGSRRRAAAGAD